MGNRDDIELMAHLLRRAGFGATRDELEQYLDQGYEATVEEMLHPGDSQRMPDDLLRRYHVDVHEGGGVDGAPAYWLYGMVSTKCPLEEKIALFWHGILASSYTKTGTAGSGLNQIEMFRRKGLGRFEDLLIELSMDPAMILELDNLDNHDGAVNENYGRELLELFSMGVGNYTEDDVKECSRAFTGWTLGNAEYMGARMRKVSIAPYGRISSHFAYRDYDHDDEEKTFLGETGRFNGQDVIDIIARQPATARFIARHIYNFFVADEAPVPQWGEIPPIDPDAIETLAGAYYESDHDIRSMLRVTFNSDFFKEARFTRVKGPVELMVGGMRLSGAMTSPTEKMIEASDLCGFMGQEILNPPTVEGWHTGSEWINSGALVDRVNFGARLLSDLEMPGVRAMIDRLSDLDGGTFTPKELVDSCLDMMGPITMADEESYSSLVGHVARQGDLSLKNYERGGEAEGRVAELLGLIASTREYQLA
jgi:uncharacterized protein (DUF1800 family)